MKPYPRHTTVRLYRNNVDTTIYQGAYVKLEQRFLQGALLSRQLHALEVDGRRVVSLRRLGPDGAGREFFSRGGYNRKLERDYSTGDIPHVFASSALWDICLGVAQRVTCQRARRLVNDWTLSAVPMLQSGIPIAVTQVTTNNAFAGFGTQRPNLIGGPGMPADERTVNRWFNTRRFRPHLRSP